MSEDGMRNSFGDSVIQLLFTDTAAFHAFFTTPRAAAETAAGAAYLAAIGFFHLGVVALISLAIALIARLVSPFFILCASLGVILAITRIVLHYWTAT